jgi:predicted AlkP superfamily pyrophosphatase or phosphodiesterase
MKKLFRAAAMLLVFCCAGCTAPTSKPVTKPDVAAYAPLILISIDGFRFDYIDRGLTPTLSALAKDGVHAKALQSSFPTLTFPNHYTIVTGLYPDHHGIINNRIVDPLSGKHFVYSDKTTTTEAAWWGGTPIWVSAERQGKHAGTMFWPGSDVAIEDVRPSQWVSFDKTIPSDSRVDRVLGWFDLPPDQRPVFLTLYFEAVDHAGHDFGPDSPEVAKALQEVDGAVAHLIDGMKQRGIDGNANLVIVSDHGMTAAGEDKIVVLDRIVDMQHVDLIGAGVVAGLAAKSGYAAEVEKALLGAHDHMHCWHKAELPARLHYGTNPRIPPLTCVADDGWQISTQQYVDNPRHHFSKGEHGYDNDDPNMRALFIAHGPAFKRGLVVPEFENVNIYPLLAHVLGVEPAANDGDLAVTKNMLR